MKQILELCTFNIRLLTFRTTREEFESFTNEHLYFGLVCTWIVGMGRWWDDPGANLAQHLGLGSIAYIFVLALLLCVIIMPLSAKGKAYRHVLTFVSLTSLPALLYAIPVERFFSLETARTMNIWFLSIVALWRVGLYLFYLRRHIGFTWFREVVVGFLPLTLIVTVLTVLNLERVVIRIMAGLQEHERSANDGAYGLLVVLTILSFYLFLPLLLSYIFLAVKVQRTKYIHLKRGDSGEGDSADNV